MDLMFDPELTFPLAREIAFIKVWSLLLPEHMTFIVVIFCMEAKLVLECGKNLEETSGQVHFLILRRYESGETIKTVRLSKW